MINLKDWFNGKTELTETETELTEEDNLIYLKIKELGLNKEDVEIWKLFMYGR